MEANAYLDFDLRFTKEADGYRAEIVQSPGGVGAGSFRLPFQQHELENYLLKIGQRRSLMRKADSPENVAAREFGNRLYETVFKGDLAKVLQKSIENAQSSDRGLRIRLRLGDTPELADLPWEYLYEARRREFLALSKDTPVVRYFDLPDKVKPLAVTPPLRVLVMLSNPSDVDCLEVEKEWQKLKDAVRDLEERKLIIMDRLPRATLTDLQNALRKVDYHVFHFVGHGSFNPATQESVLALENEKGRSWLVSGDELGIYLRDERALRLVLLNACEGARASISDPYSGAAQSLVLKGIPAVIAMQFEVSDEAAIAMASGFYAALADDYPVDAALTEARKAVFAAGCTVEWGTPVLYMRAEDGRIFDVTKTPEQKAAAAARPIAPPPIPPPVPVPVQVTPEVTKPRRVEPVAPVTPVAERRQKSAPRRWVWMLVGIVFTFIAFMVLGLWINSKEEAKKKLEAEKAAAAAAPSIAPEAAQAVNASKQATEASYPTPPIVTKQAPDFNKILKNEEASEAASPSQDNSQEIAQLREELGALNKFEAAINAIQAQPSDTAVPAGLNFSPVGSWVTFTSPPPLWSAINFDASGRFVGVSYSTDGNAQISGNWSYNPAASWLAITYDNGAWVQLALSKRGNIFYGSFTQNGVFYQAYLARQE